MFQRRARIFRRAGRNRACPSRVRANVELALRLPRTAFPGVAFPRTAPPRRTHAFAQVTLPFDDGALVAQTLAGRSEAFEELVDALRSRRLPPLAQDAARPGGGEGRDPGGVLQGLPRRLRPSGRARSSRPGSSRSPITPVATDSRAASVNGRGAARPGRPGPGPRSRRPRPRTRRRCCAPRSTACRRNTASSSPSTTSKANSTRRSPGPRPADGYREDPSLPGQRTLPAQAREAILRGEEMR